MFFYLCEVLFSGFFQFKGNFVSGRKNVVFELLQVIFYLELSSLSIRSTCIIDFLLCEIVKGLLPISQLISFNQCSTMLTRVQRLDPLFVVIRELDISDVTFVPRIHDGFPHAGMFQAQTVSKLVNCHPVQVDAVASSRCKSFVVVKVCVTR